MLLSDSPTQSIVSTLGLYRDIAILRRGPEDLPVSWLCLVATILAMPLVAVIMGSILPEVPPQPVVDDNWMVLLAVELSVPLLWGWLTVSAAGRPERYLQTMTAVFGFQLVLQPVATLAIWATRYFPKESSWLLLGQAAYFGLSVWSIIVMARILRAATEWPMMFCVPLVIAQILAVHLIDFALFPELAKSLEQAQ